MKKWFMFVSVFCLFSIRLHASENLSSKLIDSLYPNHKIEIAVKKPDSQRFPLLLVLPGTQQSGLKSISPSFVDHWVKRGYAVATVSLPGFGESTGEKDFCGPFTLSSLSYAIDAIKKELGVSEYGIIGFGQGGLAATLLSSIRRDINCIVFANGGYDFLRHTAAEDPLMRAWSKNAYHFNYQDEQELAWRSPIYLVQTAGASFFLLHRKGNPVVKEEEVIAYSKALHAAGKKCRLVFKDRAFNADEQMLSYAEVLAEAEAWIDNHMLGFKS